MFSKKNFQFKSLDESLIEEIPPKVFYKFRQRFKDLTVYQVEYAAKGFLSFLSVCKAFPNMNIPMPSETVDEIWHEFILHTKDYALFCDKHLGKFLHHTPNQNIEKNKISEREVSEILHLWTLTCLQEEMDPFSEDSKPSLFYSDVELGVKEELPNYAKMLKRKTGLKSSESRHSSKASSNKLEEYKMKKKHANNSDPMLATLLLVDLYLYTDPFIEAKHAAAVETSLTSCGTGSIVLLNCSSSNHSCGSSNDGSNHSSCGGNSCSGGGCGGGD